MKLSVPENCHVILLPLQSAQDVPPLEQFAKLWTAAGRESTLINTDSLRYPAQWISLFSRCKIMVAMRLHALIMALKAGVPVVGIAYDPKVSHLLAEFEQPTLILTKEAPENQWQQTMKAAFEDTDKLSRRAMRKAEGAKKLACQNFDMLARILSTQKHS
jgi:polysaccharide pyruvyl transferase WcaK-like protein